MGTMVQIKAHQVGTQTHDEDEGYALTLFVLISNLQKRLVPGIYYGEIKEADEKGTYYPYPFRYDAHHALGNSKLFFGGYSCGESFPEEYYLTNLNQKSLIEGEYFTVTNLDEEELTFMIDRLVDMNALQIAGD